MNADSSLLFSVSCQGAQGPPGGVGAMGGVGEKVRACAHHKMATVVWSLSLGWTSSQHPSI